MVILDRYRSKPPISRHLYHKNSSRTFSNIHYCKGIVIYTDDTFIRATFVFYESLAIATQAFERYARLNHSGVVRSWSLSDDEGTEGTGYEGRGFYAVSFNQFACFLTEYPAAERLFSATSNIPGIPNEWVRSIIKGLIKAIKHLYSIGLNCGAFELPKAYVWVFDENQRVISLKLFLVDECLDDYAPGFQRCLQEDGIFSFGLMLQKYVLVEPSEWVMRDTFFECFDKIHNFRKEVPLCPMDRLSMIEESPFLEDNIYNILHGILKAQMALERDTLPGYDIANLKTALNEEKLFAEICPSGHWRDGISDGFKTYLDNQMAEEGKKSNKDLCSQDIQDHKLSTLIEWNSNPFQHGSLSDNYIYNEAFGRWEKLFSKVHQVFWHHKITGRESDEATAGYESDKATALFS